MTQLRLGIELGVTQETISAYEIEKHYPSAKSLLKMRELFSASIDYMLGLSDIRMPINTEVLSNEEVATLNLYCKLSKGQKEKVISYMQGMLED